MSNDQQSEQPAASTQQPNDPNPHNQQAPSRFPMSKWKGLSRIAASVMILGVVALVIIYADHGCQRFDDGIRDTARVVLQPGTMNITRSFVAQTPRVTGTTLLTVARIESPETFKRSTTVKRSFFPDLSQSIEMTIPVTYSYYIDLNSPSWDIEVVREASANQELKTFAFEKCVVYTPSLELHDPPAVHLDKLQAFSQKKTFVIQDFNEAQKDSLMVQVGEEVRSRGLHQVNMDIAELIAEGQVERFVENWLLRSTDWGEAEYSVIEVHIGVASGQPEGNESP